MLLVRRKGRAMPAELGRGGQQAERIDWRKSVLLNLVVQATYCLTVATCRSLAALMFRLSSALCKVLKLQAPKAVPGMKPSVAVLLSSMRSGLE